MAHFTPEYETAASYARADAKRLITVLQTLPGGFAPFVDVQNAQHQQRIATYVGALAREEVLRLPRGEAAPLIALDNLQNACDMAAGWLARIVKQTGGVPNA